MTLRQRLEAEASAESHLSKSSQHGSRFRQMSELQKWPKYEAGEKPVQLLTHYVPTDGSRQSRPSMLTSFLRTEAVGRGNPCNPVETGKPLFCRNLPGLPGNPWVGNILFPDPSQLAFRSWPEIKPNPQNEVPGEKS